MKKQSLLKRQAWLGVFVLVCAGLVVGCQDQAIPVAPNADDTAVLGKKGGGGNGGGAAFTVAMVGGVDTQGLHDLGSFKENRRQISGKVDVFTVKLDLMQTKAYAFPVLGEGCSFTCDDPALECAVGAPDGVHEILANAFVSDAAPHPTEATPGYTGLNIGFDKDAALDATVLSSCPFTGIAGFEPPSGGGVLIRNCYVRYVGDPTDRTFRVEAHSANTVSTARRFETDGNEGLGPQDYRASLACPIKDAFTVSFAPK